MSEKLVILNIEMQSYYFCHFNIPSTTKIVLMITIKNI